MRVPQFKEVKGWVQPLSEYTLKFAVEEIVPFDGKFEFVLRAA